MFQCRLRCPSLLLSHITGCCRLFQPGPPSCDTPWSHQSPMMGHGRAQQHLYYQCLDLIFIPQSSMWCYAWLHGGSQRVLTLASTELFTYLCRERNTWSDGDYQAINSCSCTSFSPSQGTHLWSPPTHGSGLPQKTPATLNDRRFMAKRVLSRASPGQLGNAARFESTTACLRGGIIDRSGISHSDLPQPLSFPFYHLPLCWSLAQPFSLFHWSSAWLVDWLITRLTQKFIDAATLSSVFPT